MSSKKDYRPDNVADSGERNSVPFDSAEQLISGTLILIDEDLLICGKSEERRKGGIQNGRGEKMKSDDHLPPGQLAGEGGDIEVQEDAMKQRQGMFDAEQEGDIKDVACIVEEKQKEMEENQKHPDREDLVGSGFILLADQEELKENRQTDAGNEEWAHDTPLVGLILGCSGN